MQSNLRFALAAIPIVIGLSFTPAMAQSRDDKGQGCPAGYWQMDSLCFNSTKTPSAPGGGGKSLADCMGFWDRETHMSKAEWKAACIRTMQDELTVLPWSAERQLPWTSADETALAALDLIEVAADGS